MKTKKSRGACLARCSSLAMGPARNCLVVLSRLYVVRFYPFALGRAIALCLSCPLPSVVLHVAMWRVCACACSCHRGVFVVVVAAKAWLVNNNNERKENK